MAVKVTMLWGYLCVFLLNFKGHSNIFISFFITSYQRVLLFLSSSSYAWVMFLGTLRPYLWVTFFIQDFTLAIILYLFFKVNGGHHANDGLSINSLSSAYYAVWIPCDSLIPRSGTHDFSHHFIVPPGTILW